MRVPRFQVGYETEFKTLESEAGRDPKSGAVLYMWRCKKCNVLHGPSSGTIIMSTVRTKCCPRQKAEKRNYRGREFISGERLAQYKHNAYKRGISFTMTDAQHLVDVWHQQEGKCAYTGKPLVLGDGASIDRIDPAKGYEEGNVQWVLFSVNTMKGTLTDEEFLENCKLIVERRKL